MGVQALGEISKYTERAEELLYETPLILFSL